jgi:MSHA biogenesis protein MshJ
MKLLRVWLIARSARERWMMVLTTLALLITLVEFAVLAPLRTERAHIGIELAAARAQFDKLQGMLPAAIAQDAQRNEELRARRAAAEQKIASAQVDLISPRDMTQHLATLLAHHPQLRVVGIQSQPPSPVLAGDNGVAERAPAVHALYRHGLQVQVEGRYLDLLAYLAALEKTPRRLYWRALDMKVPASGIPMTTLELFTLSTEAVWLRL